MYTYIYTAAIVVVYDVIEYYYSICRGPRGNEHGNGTAHRIYNCLYEEKKRQRRKKTIHIHTHIHGCGSPIALWLLFEACYTHHMHNVPTVYRYTHSHSHMYTCIYISKHWQSMHTRPLCICCCFSFGFSAGLFDLLHVCQRHRHRATTTTTATTTTKERAKQKTMPYARSTPYDWLLAICSDVVQVVVVVVIVGFHSVICSVTINSYASPI